MMVAEAYFIVGWRFVLQFKLSLSRMVPESIVSCPFKERAFSLHDVTNFGVCNMFWTSLTLRDYAAEHKTFLIMIKKKKK